MPGPFYGLFSGCTVPAYITNVLTRSCTVHVFAFTVIPVPLVAAWLLVQQLWEGGGGGTHCSQAYSLMPSYWILEGPRIFVIVVSGRSTLNALLL